MLLRHEPKDFNPYSNIPKERTFSLNLHIHNRGGHKSQPCRIFENYDQYHITGRYNQAISQGEFINGRGAFYQ
jgi:hypothetical protein